MGKIISMLLTEFDFHLSLFVRNHLYRIKLLRNLEELSGEIEDWAVSYFCLIDFRYPARIAYVRHRSRGSRFSCCSDWQNQPEVSPCLPAPEADSCPTSPDPSPIVFPSSGQSPQMAQEGASTRWHSPNCGKTDIPIYFYIPIFYVSIYYLFP